MVKAEHWRYDRFLHRKVSPYFPNDYLNDEDCPAIGQNDLPMGDLNYDFGTNCADASPDGSGHSATTH